MKDKTELSSIPESSLILFAIQCTARANGDLELLLPWNVKA